jgi:hypothetical protein
MTYLLALLIAITLDATPKKSTKQEGQTLDHAVIA